MSGKPTMKKASPPGFTLIELIAVIAVLALLAALLTPLLFRAREKGRAAVCLSNLRQIGGAFHFYDDDYQIETSAFFYENDPATSDSDPDLFQRADWRGATWYDRLSPYLKAKEILACPSNAWTQEWRDRARSAPEKFTFKLQYPTVCGSADVTQFACAAVLTGGGDTLPDARSYGPIIPVSADPNSPLYEEIYSAIERDPSQALLLGESRLPAQILAYINPGMATREVRIQVQPQELLTPLPSNGGFLQTHGGKTNWLFYDGHVQSLSMRQTLTPQNRWTNRPQDQQAFDDLADELLPEYK